jgi:hypothetical protein
MARELVSLKPDVPYTRTGTGLQAATLARTSIPIIVGVASDLVGSSEEFGGARWKRDRHVILGAQAGPEATGRS